MRRQPVHDVHAVDDGLVVLAPALEDSQLVAQHDDLKLGLPG
ncbi:MAG: hypothetical protein ABI571_04020 [Actinomycetota bacterium]